MLGASAMGGLVLILLSLCLISGEAVDFSEKSQLLELKKAIVDPHNLLSSWKSTNPNHCSWFGVTCNSHGRVSELRIPGGNFAKSGSCFSSKKYSDLALHGFGIVRDCSSFKKGKFLGGKLLNVIGKFSELVVLSLPFHQIGGELPAGIWGLKKLEVIDIEGNSMTANLSMINFTNLKNLKILNLGFNRLFGEIPNSLSECQDLAILNLAGNRIEGNVPAFLGNFVKLKGINLSLNRFKGSLMDGFWSNCHVLEHVDFSSNFLDGKIPKSFRNCSKLRTMLLFSNSFSGNIPFELGNLRMLEILDVSRNNLVGIIPTSIGNCLNLTILVLSSDFNDHHRNGLIEDGNFFESSIPLQITTLPNLKLMWAPNANLDGEFPRNWGDCRALRMVNLAGNHLKGELSGIFESCPNLRFLNVSNNIISGEIPTNVGVNWKCLKFLDASKNQISGRIPKSLVNLRNLTVLLLNNNRLSGEVPLGRLNLKSGFKFNFSFNNLSGSIAMDRDAINCNCFIGNPLLYRCQIISLSSVPTQEPWAVGPGSLNSTGSPNSNGAKKGMNSFELVLIIVPSVIVVILVALIIVYLYMRKRKPKSAVSGSSAVSRRSSRPLPPTHSGQPEPLVVFKEIGVELTFDTVVQATGNFTSRNCIGSGGFGSTYRAEISPGTTVAVKRLMIEMCQGLPQFNAEIQSLGRIRHPNLVTLIGYYASSSEMFLVYNYLAGGNLEKIILERSRRVIGLKILHKIALDVANALYFLHDQCNPRILHRDVKPSNILLDEEFNAYLSDFGLARLLDDFDTHVTTDVAGTFGYVAPEYALLCRASEKVDVYSYGVMILELISDKRALDSSFSSQENGYTIVSWAVMLRREGRPEEVFAAGLWEAGPEDVLLELLHLGLQCTAESVAGRPTMSQVVRKLKQIQPVTDC